MKRINTLFLFTLFLNLSSCMPDSLTKFEEESTKKQKKSSSSGGITQEEGINRISKVYYNQSTGQTLVMKVGSGASFTVGEYISVKPEGSTGIAAKINYIDGSNIYVEITTPSITSETTIFQNESLVDDAEEYFTDETSISDNIVYSFSLGENMGDSSKGFFPYLQTQSTINPDNFTFSLTPSLDNFASSGIYFVNKGACYSNSEFPSCKDAACTIDTAYTTKSSCNSNSAKVWAAGGTIHGTPTKAVQTTDFSLKISDPNGNTISTNFSMSLSEPPKGLSYSRNLLLHVPSSSAFTINDAISSNTGGEGTVLGVYKSNNGSNNASKSNQIELDYIEVRLLKGTFKAFDDIDNNARYGAQKTYILGGGVIAYSVKVQVDSSSDFKDPLYTDYKINENLISIYDTGSGLIKAKARIKYHDKNRFGLGHFLYLSTTDEGLSIDNAGHIISTISQTDSLISNNLPITVSKTVAVLHSTNSYIRTSVNLTNQVAGHDITGDPSVIGSTKPTATINSSDSATQTYYITNNQGLFKVSDNIDSENPFGGVEALVSSISSDKTFYLYRGDEAIIISSIDVTDRANIKYSVDTLLPPGLVLDIDTGIISGTPTDAAEKQTYILTASSPFGQTSYRFDIKVNDQIIIRNKTDSFSYIMHRGLQGNQRTNCRVTKDQINAYAPDAINKINNIHCFLDAGEVELHSKGVKLELDIGADMCQHLVFTPYFTNQFMRGETIEGTLLNDNSAISTIGNKIAYKHIDADADQCERPYEYTTDSAGANQIGRALANPLNFSDSPKYLCEFDHNLWNTEYPNCDSGSILVREITYTPFDSGVGCSQAENDVVYECGGKQSSCIAGPALTIMGKESLDAGLFSKISSISAAEAKIEYTFDAPLKHAPVPYSTNMSVANYMNIAGCKDSNYEIKSAAINAYSKNLSMNIVGQQNPMTQTNPIYRFNCIDAAGETKAYINLYIRDWDQAFTASDDIDLVSPTALMDVGGGFNGRNDYNNIFSSGDNICGANGVGSGTGSVWDILGSGNNFLEGAL